jgi:hypothetical protein
MSIVGELPPSFVALFPKRDNTVALIVSPSSIAEVSKSKIPLARDCHWLVVAEARKLASIFPPESSAAVPAPAFISAHAWSTNDLFTIPSTLVLSTFGSG